MQEIEILVRVNNDFSTAHENLKRHGQEDHVAKIRDVYLVDPLRPNLAQDEKGNLKEALRIRETEKGCTLTYKLDCFDVTTGAWTHSEEHEVDIADAQKGLQIFYKLGFQEVVVVNVEKYYFTTPLYKIALERVEDLGLFMEVEAHQVSDERNVAKVRNDIANFIEKLNLNVSADVGIGKPELLLRQRQQK